MNKFLLLFLVMILALQFSPEIISQDSTQKNSVLYAQLGTGFKENERLLLFFVKGTGEKKKLYSGKYHRNNDNIFTVETGETYRYSLEIYAPDRNQSIRYRVITERSPVIRITISISKSGFHVLYSDN